MQFAVIETGGKQYLVKSGSILKIEKIEGVNDGALVFGKVLLRIDGDNLQVGTPYLDKVQVDAKVVRQGRTPKKIVFKYSSKTRYRKKKGHRQMFTEVEIVKI